jgi:hypothetical protein
LQKTTKYLFLFFLLVLSGLKAKAQDRIIKADNDTLKVRIAQITYDKIRYRFYGMKNGPIYEIPKNQVKQIIYENGSSLTIVYNLFEVKPDLMIKDRSKSWKVDLASPFLNHITIAYEQKMKLGKNLEVKGGFIGFNLNKELYFTQGFLLKAGIKYLKCSNTIRKGLKYTNPMKGTYVKPELMVDRYTSIESGRKINSTNVAAACLFGRQYIIGNVVCIDVYGGAGVGYQNNSRGPSRRQDDFSYCFSHIFFGKKFPMILTGGFLVGIVF